MADKERQKWLERISDEDKAHKVWRDRAKSAENAYCRFDETEASPTYPVYYSTVQLLLGKISGSPPKPDVRKLPSALAHRVRKANPCCAHPWPTRPQGMGKGLRRSAMGPAQVPAVPSGQSAPPQPGSASTRYCAASANAASTITNKRQDYQAFGSSTST